jgi:hypothetical protein
VSAVNFWGKMLNIDRRWIFLLIGVVSIVPFLIPVGMPITTTSEVESIYDCIDSLGPDNAIFLGFDFDPGTDAENMPMSVAVMRHAFYRHIPVFMTAYTPLGHGMMMSGFEYVTDPTLPGCYTPVPFADWATYRDAGIVDRAGLVAAWEADGHVLPENSVSWVFEGRDYALLGYLPLFHLVILGMTSSIEAQYPTDAHGNPLGEMPMLQEHKSLREVDLALTMAGSSACMSWIIYGREKIGLPIAFGVTAVMATDYFPFIQSGQVIGQMGGLRGAAEYEVLMERNGVSATTDKAFTGMDVQSAAHLLIILLIIMGNVAYFAGGFNKQSLLKSGR